jgi:hypothetical protein
MLDDYDDAEVDENDELFIIKVVVISHQQLQHIIDDEHDELDDVVDIITDTNE